MYIKQTEDVNIFFSKKMLNDAYEHLTCTIGDKENELFITNWTTGNQTIRQYDTFDIYPYPLECPKSIDEHRRAKRWTALMRSSRARRERVHLSVQAGPGYTAEVSPSCRASSMGNALAIPVQAEPGLAAVAAPSFHRGVRAWQHVHSSTRAGPGRIVSSERDGQRVHLPVLAGPGHISSECKWQRVHRSRLGAHRVERALTGTLRVK